MALSVSPPGALNIVSSIGPEFRDQNNPGGISGGSADFKSCEMPVWRLQRRPVAPHPAPRPRPRLKSPQHSILTRHSLGHHRRIPRYGKGGANRTSIFHRLIFITHKP